MIRINDLYPTIQGEGAYTGVPVVLIRLQGCGVGCPWCDTKETWRATEKFRVDTLDLLLASRLADHAPLKPHWCAASEEDIAHAARLACPNVFTAMVTGGEPAEQDLTALNEALRDQGFLPVLETSGTAPGFFSSPWAWVCLSPKLNMPGGKPVLEEAVRLADEIKLVISDREQHDESVAWVKNRLIGLKPGYVISLQPESQNPEATRLCVETCLQESWRLSIQTHKFIGVR